jgi:hypothetical protein
MQNNMNSSEETHILEWLTQSPKHMADATRIFPYDMMKTTGRHIERATTACGKRVWDHLAGGPEARKRNRNNPPDHQEPYLETRTNARHYWMPWYTLKEHIEHKDVWKPIPDSEFWLIITETLNLKPPFNHSFMIKVLDGNKVMLKLTPKTGDYTKAGIKANTNDGNKDGGGPSNWSKQTDGGEKKSGSQASEWGGQGGSWSDQGDYDWGAAGWQQRAADTTMPPPQQPSAEQQTTGPTRPQSGEDAEKPPPQSPSGQRAMAANLGNQQQSPTGQQPAADSKVGNLSAAEQPGMVGQKWPNVMQGNQEADYSMGGQKGSDPGPPPCQLNFDLQQGPPTWLIGQWHPMSWNEDTKQPTSWYMVEQGEECNWKNPDGSTRYATIYHDDIGKHQKYRNDMQNQGKGYNPGVSPWGKAPEAQWDTKGKQTKAAGK